MRVVCDMQLKCMLRTRTSLKQKNAKMVELRVFVCANSSTAVRILDEPCSYISSTTEAYRLAYTEYIGALSEITLMGLLNNRYTSVRTYLGSQHYLRLVFALHFNTHKGKHQAL